MKTKVFIIAEAGVNHNGCLDTAKRMIDAAVKSGVDAVKFQTFKASRLASELAPKADYQISCSCSDETQRDMLKRLELSRDAHLDLMEHCRINGVTFLSSPFDVESADFLNSLGMEIFKVPSGEITDLPYLRKVGSFGKKVIISTGMAEMGEVEKAIDVLESSGTKRADITALHCNTDYPTVAADVNLRAMRTIEDKCGVATGYSDHTVGIEVAVAAAALGARVIEKHFTLDRNMEGPDHKASLEPRELEEMVDAIRNVELALGDGIKRPTSSEFRNKKVVRKSIVAARNIEKGELFADENMTAMRPGGGVSPMDWDLVCGRRAKRTFKKGEAIEL